MANEKRLIDANALSCDVFSVKCCLFTDKASEWTKGYRNALEAVLEMIDEQPKVEAVEVVRCKGCKHYYHSAKEIGWRCELNKQVWHKDDFCFYGERKDNERKAD